LLISSATLLRCERIGLTVTLETAGSEVEGCWSWAGRQVSWVLDIDVMSHVLSPTSTSMSSLRSARLMLSPYIIITITIIASHASSFAQTLLRPRSKTMVITIPLTSLPKICRCCRSSHSRQCQAVKFPVCS